MIQVSVITVVIAGNNLTSNLLGLPMIPGLCSLVFPAISETMAVVFVERKWESWEGSGP